MKAIIYAGIGLFSVASVYGLVDYYGSQKNGSLKKLYVEEEIPVAPPEEEKSTVILPLKNVEPAPVEARVVNTKPKLVKKVKPSREIRIEDYSRGKIPMRLIEEKPAEVPVKKEPEPVSELKTEIRPVSNLEPSVVKRDVIIAADRDIDFSKFSRAPLKMPVKSTKKIKSKKG